MNGFIRDTSDGFWGTLYSLFGLWMFVRARKRFKKKIETDPLYQKYAKFVILDVNGEVVDSTNAFPLKVMVSSCPELYSEEYKKEKQDLFLRTAKLKLNRPWSLGIVMEDGNE